MATRTDTHFSFAEELAPRMTGEGLMALAEAERRLNESDRRRDPRPGIAAGRRAIDRMQATPKELDRMCKERAARDRAIKKYGLEEYYDEDFTRDGWED